MGLDGDLFENAINVMKNSRNAASDTDLTAEDLQELVAEFKKIFSENVSGVEYPSLLVDGVVAFPQDPMVQLKLAIEAVFGSWNNPARRPVPQARTRSPMTWAPPSTCSPWCSATRANTSATGVAFTRNPANGHEGVLRRLPGQRPGRGRRGRHPQHQPHRRAEARRGP